jgi:hypothetical protein
VQVTAVFVLVIVVFVLAVFAAELLVGASVSDLLAAFQAFRPFLLRILVVHTIVIYESEYDTDFIKRQAE